MATTTREFELTTEAFGYIRTLVMENTGIVINENKRELIYSRLSKRLRSLGLRSFDDYLKVLDNGNNRQEMVAFINSITTNLTAFFRENHHFEFLREKGIPECSARARSGGTIRVWSAGCSTGEEPYSIAMTFAETLGFSGVDWRILATDIDTEVLTTASQRIYAEDRVTGISPPTLKRWFRRGTGPNTGRVQVSPQLAERITFRQLNLIQPWPFKQKFDIIFCRNVVIYFDLETQKKIFNNYANQLNDNGLLFIGHSESLFKVTDRFDSIGHTIYRKRK
jgi:chemotaxis protein methyltransferase CheR